MNDEARRFDGAVYDEVDADIGTNRAGRRVVRLDLTFSDAASPTTYTAIVSLDAAITLRNQLDGLFAAAGVDDSGGLVDVDDACPRCGERDQDSLVWQDDATIHCTNCGTRYDPDAQQDAAASQPQ